MTICKLRWQHLLLYSLMHWEGESICKLSSKLNFRHCGDFIWHTSIASFKSLCASEQVSVLNLHFESILHLQTAFLALQAMSSLEALWLTICQCCCIWQVLLLCCVILTPSIICLTTILSCINYLREDHRLVESLRHSWDHWWIFWHEVG